MNDFFRNLMLRGLSSIHTGRLVVEDATGFSTFGRPDRRDLWAHVTVHSPRAYRRIALGGGLGAAESYLRGEWTTDDLPSVLRVFAANLAVADRLESPVTRLLNLGAKLAHWLRRNTRGGSRRNIRDHYDLGNDLFALFLDNTMTYSCGVFETPHATLEQASIAKLDAVCRKLQLSADDHVVEIGSGWGSFAIHAARRYGCRVTTTTISDAQYEVAAQRVAEAGLSGRVTLLRQDYRTLSGSFDKLVSIEMVEAVGAEYLGEYFGVCSKLLSPHGQALIQGIIVPEHRFKTYLRSVDFIQRYVFPGGGLTSVGAIADAIGRTTDLRINHVEDLSQHYALTLRAWRQRFLARADDVRALGGYDERFIRLWDYYLAYCEAGFSERCTGVVQALLTKPACRRGDVVPATVATYPLDVAV